MDKQRKSSDHRKGVQSLFIPSVPKIKVDSTETPDSVMNPMPHSRSAGELAMSAASTFGGNKQKTDSGNYFNGSSTETRSVVDIYCSPRLQRRTFRSNNNNQFHEDGQWLDTYDMGTSTNMLGPGSRSGSAVSLTSEYTSRSVGLISNDSSSDSTQFSDKMEQLKQKQSLLRRYMSNPEKPQNDSGDNSVQRSAKSVGNICNESKGKHVLNDDLDSECTDSSMGENLLPDFLADSRRKSSRESMEDDSYPNLVTMITNDISVKEGRIRQWLTDIGKPGK